MKEFNWTIEGLHEDTLRKIYFSAMQLEESSKEQSVRSNLYI